MISVSRILECSGNPKLTLEVSISDVSKEGDDYYVCLNISGNDMEFSKKVYGIDPIQSIQLAFLEARKHLNSLPYPVRWEGGQDGDHGFMITIPSPFGIELSRRIEKLVEEEMESYSLQIISQRQDEKPRSRIDGK